MQKCSSVADRIRQTQNFLFGGADFGEKEEGVTITWHFPESRKYTPGERVSGIDLLNHKIHYYPKGKVEL